MSQTTGALGVLTEKNVAVPMRDGTILRANLFRPATGSFAAILLRTPYGKPEGGFERYVRAGYAVVCQDSRGRYASDGEYVPFTVEDTGDAEDGYDSVEWLAQQPWCDGRVATLGASYNAWMQWQLAKLRPPALKAMCAYTIPLELTEVDWPGAFKPGRRVKWWLTTMAPDLRRREGLPPPHTPEQARRLWDEVEKGHWLGFVPWIELPRHLPKKLATYVEDWLLEPQRRPWKFAQVHAEVEVPNLDFSGWYDHCNVSIGHLAGMQSNGGSPLARQQTKLVIGPWNHPGLGQRQIGEIDFGPQAQLDLPDMIIRFFDRWVKGIENGVDAEPAARYFVMGSGQWKEAATWPPPGLAEQVFYLDVKGTEEDSGALLASAPQQENSDSYSYDPRDPVPTLWSSQLFSSPADRRQLEHRADILYYRTPPLEQGIEVVGYPRVLLKVASTARDTDFFARLVDEHPAGGPALEVCYGMVRARYRNGFDREELLDAYQPVVLEIKLGATACSFLPGHRLRLEITSSDFPNHDRNHNIGRNDLMDEEMVVARQKVFCGGAEASRLIVKIEGMG